MPNRYCVAMSDRYDQLQPPSLISAIKSMPRRWSAALYLQPPKNIDDYFAVPGPDGVSAAEHSGAMITQLETLNDAIRTTSYNASEELGPEVRAAITDSGSGPWPKSAAEAIAMIEVLMELIAERLTGLSASDWNKSAQAPGGSLSISTLAQAAVRIAAERLRRAEQAIDAVS